MDDEAFIAEVCNELARRGVPSAREIVSPFVRQHPGNSAEDLASKYIATLDVNYLYYLRTGWD